VKRSVEYGGSVMRMETAVIGVKDGKRRKCAAVEDAEEK